MGRRVIEDYGVADIIDAFDETLQSLGVHIKGQNVELLTKIRGVNEIYVVLASNKTVAGDGGEWTSDALDLDEFSGVRFLISASVANSGEFSYKVQTSSDKSTWVDVPFSTDEGNTWVNSATFNDGNANTAVYVPKHQRYIRMKITPDGTNDITLTLLNALRLI